MAKAGGYFGRLRQRLWNSRHVSMRAKGKIYRALVLSTLPCAVEAWAVYIRQVEKMHSFMMRHLRSITMITWMDKVTKRKYSNGQGCHLYKMFCSERISVGLHSSWGYRQTGYHSGLSTLNYLLAIEIEGALVCGSRIPSRET